jgi:hypothetical protein
MLDRSLVAFSTFLTLIVEYCLLFTARGGAGVEKAMTIGTYIETAICPDVSVSFLGCHYC